MRYARALAVALAVASLLYIAAAGVGLVPFNPLQLSPGQFRSGARVVVLNSFEHRTDAFLRTDSYVKLKRIKANASHGRYSLQAELYLEGWFYPTPTPAAGVPGATPVPKVEWRPTIYYAHDSVSKMRRSNWRGFDYFKMDVILGEDRPANSYLLAGDAHGYSYQTPTQVLESKKINVLALDVNDMKENYLDISAIQYVAFVFDIAGRGRPPIVYLDNFRLERAPK